MKCKVNLSIILLLVFSGCKVKESKNPMMIGLGSVRFVEKKPNIADSYSFFSFTVKLYNYDTVGFNIEKDVSDTAYVAFLDNDTVLASGKIVLSRRYYNLNKSRVNTIEIGDSIGMDFSYTEHEAISLIEDAATWYKRNKGFNNFDSGSYFMEFINHIVKKPVKLDLKVKNRKITLINKEFIRI
jgi:hypothetical protein